MPSLSETRQSLLLRLRDLEDHTAWGEFLAIYEAAVFRFARSRGLQHADAEDVTQDVLLAVHNQLENWDPDPAKGGFRAWLFRVTRNLAAKALSTTRKQLSGDTRVLALLEQLTDAGPEDDAAFYLEYRRQVFLRATECVRPQVQESTWQAFWLTTVENRGIPEVAELLDLSVGSVYTARCRVMARLREVIRSFDME